MTITFTDKDFKKHLSFEFDNLTNKLLAETRKKVKHLGDAEDIRVIIWDKRRILRFEDMDLEKILKEKKSEKKSEPEKEPEYDESVF